MSTKRKKEPRRPRRMQNYGYRAQTTFLKDDLYFPMDKRVRDLKISKTRYIRNLIEKDLRDAGYLRGERVPPGQAPGKENEA